MTGSSSGLTGRAESERRPEGHGSKAASGPQHPFDDELAQAADLPVDSHLHTDLSSDSRVPIDVYAQIAFNRGILELAITDHLDFDPRGPNFAFSDYSSRQRHVREAAERWAGRVAIRFGVEVTYESSRENDIREHLASHDYDFVIGSVHVHSYSEWDPPRLAADASDRAIRQAVGAYFAEVGAAARSRLFDTIGHVDYVKKYLARSVAAARFEHFGDLYDPLLRTIVEEGVGLEVNSSGLRHVTGETYPAQWAIDRFRELGGARVTVGSDAHAPEQLAFGLARAYRFAAEAGFDTVAFRRGRQPIGIDIPRRLMPGG